MKIWMTVLCALSFAFLGAEEEHEFVGRHFIVTYADCDHEALCNIEALTAAMHEGVHHSGATVLKESSYVFPGDGFTMTLLLSESHASIHTYPEYNSCFVDLFTCGNTCQHGPFDEVLREYLKPGKVSSKLLIRDEAITEVHSK